jgi:SNF2 family DNA or RNA helicase
MKKTLTAEQREDARALYSGEAKACWSAIGTGKTLVGLEVIRLQAEYNLAPSLVVAPPVSLSMWQQEAISYLGPSNYVQVIDREDVPIESETEVVVISSGLVARRKQDLSRPWSTVILDEAHLYKNPASARTQALFGPRCTGQRGIVEDAGLVIPMTGTPILRYQDDLWVQLRALDPERIHKMTYEVFQGKFCNQQYRKLPGTRQSRLVVTGNRAGAQLDTLLEGFFIRRVLKLDIPLTQSIENVDIDPELVASSMEGDAYKDLRRAIEAYRRSGNPEYVLEALQELSSEHTSTLRRLTGMLKIEGAYQRILTRHAQDEGMPLLVFTHHTDVAISITEQLTQAGIYTEVVTGATPRGHRDAYMRAFNNGALPVLIATMGSMGVAVNLQEACSEVLVVEEDWAPGALDQAIGRVYRRGQAKPVHVTTLAVPGSIDEPVHMVLNRKREGIDLLVKET